MKIISNFLKLFICTLCLFSKIYGQKTKPNLVFVFSNPNYTEIRQELFEKSLAWMDEFDDTMVSKNEITLLCGLENVNLVMKGHTGELLGRPIDLIKKSNTKSLIPEKMQNA